MTSPLVSAVCLTRNRPSFLEKSVELFRAQTYPNKEMVIIDSGDVAAVPTRPEIRHIPIATRAAHGDLYRYGYDAARGEYLAIWDDDDWHGPERLARTISKLEASGADAVGLTPIIVLPGPTFAEWKPATIKKWHDGGSAWLPCSDNAVVWRAASSKHGKPFSHMTQMYRRMYDAGAKFDRIENDGLFAYVRHRDVMWKFDAKELCDAIPRPAWIPDDMVEFWRGIQ